jgi:hypothetical protein
MRSTICRVTLALVAPLVCLAQQWEVGATGGYGWYANPSISSLAGSAQAGFPAKGAIGAVFGDNMYEHVGGEIRYLFQYGGPQLQFNGVKTSVPGYTNLIVYDLLVHLRSRDEGLRPFVAGGAGIKVYTGTGEFLVNQPLLGFARLSPHTEVEPTISAGGGLKYRLSRHAQARIDFRTYFSPLPRRVFRTSDFNPIHGWVYDFMPMAGISYVF